MNINCVIRPYYKDMVEIEINFKDYYVGARMNIIHYNHLKAIGRLEDEIKNIIYNDIRKHSTFIMNDIVEED